MELKDQTITGVKWTTISTVVVTIIQLAQLSILARFLDATDFGLMAIIMVVIGFSTAFMDMGISNAIIHRQDISHTQLSSLYWLNIASGFALCAIVAATSPLVAAFYHEPRIEKLMLILSSVFVLVAVGNQYRILSQKELQFSRIAKIEISAALSSLLIAVIFAVGGYGVYALVFAMLTQAAVSSALFLITGLREHHRPALTYRHSELKGFYSFGLYQMGERSINFLSANIDKLLIGKMIGLQAAGFYNMAWYLVIFPLIKINPAVNKVAFPVYARIQHDNKAINKYYSFSIKALSLVTIPLLAFLSFFSSDIVLTVLGDGWQTTADIVKIFAFVGMLKAIANPGGAIILALGHANVGFWWNVAWTSIIAVVLYATLLLVPSVEAITYSLLGLSLTVGMVWHYIVARVGNINYQPIVQHFCKVIVVALLIAWVGAIAAKALPLENAFLRLAAGATVCLLFYSAYILLFEKEITKHLRKRA